VGSVISAGKASLAELSTILGVADLYRLLEIIDVDAYNDKLAMDWEGG
jgi:hypothetical protein